MRGDLKVAATREVGVRVRPMAGDVLGPLRRASGKATESDHV